MPQNARLFPGEDSYAITRSSPDNQRKLSRFTWRYTPYWLPEIFPQFVQKHPTETTTPGPSISNAIAPHRHDPLAMAHLRVPLGRPLWRRHAAAGASAQRIAAQLRPRVHHLTTTRYRGRQLQPLIGQRAFNRE